jgi:sporulation protein YlmC with PRC-barrel domain
MSSSEKAETFKVGAHVDATDGRCGKLISVIFDPVADVLTHLVVQPRPDEELPRMVPVDLVVGAGDDVIRLSCNMQRFEQLDDAVDLQFLPASKGFDAGAGARPYYSMGLPLGHHPPPMSSVRVPLGEVAIRRGDAVHAKDGTIGKVEGLVIDPADHHVTHVLLQEGHLWGRKQVAIPIGAANREEDALRVDLTKAEIEALPPVDLKSHG